MLSLLSIKRVTSKYTTRNSHREDSQIIFQNGNQLNRITFKLYKTNKNISQIVITKNTSIVTSVVSTKLTILEDKKFIKRLYSGNNRSKKITLTKNGYNLVENLILNVERVEKHFFEKLNQETFNFTNSLKLLLGKKIRIKANYNE